VGGDRVAGALGGRAVRANALERLRPQAGGIGIEPEDDLGFAGPDEGFQPVAEGRIGRGLGAGLLQRAAQRQWVTRAVRGTFSR
jgi:hypothetical protein